MKFLGIGVGNSAYEVEVFKDNYQIPFPLFPDPTFALHKILGETRTPFFIVIRLNQKAPGEVIYSQLGEIENTAQFMELLKSTGLKRGK